MKTRSKQFEALRKKFALDNGSVDDVVEKLEDTHETFGDEANNAYVMLNCPFADEFDCKYGLVEEWHDSGEEEFLYVAMAAHMLTGHLEYEE